MGDETLEKILTKMDAFCFLYTDSNSSLLETVTGKARDNKERFVTSFLLNPNDVDVFQRIMSLGCSIHSRTLIMDYRLLTDEMIDVLKDLYQSHRICGIRILPEDQEIPFDLIQKFDTPVFDNFLLAASHISCDDSFDHIDFFDEKGVCSIEKVSFSRNEESLNIHITRKLSREEIGVLSNLLSSGSFDKIFVDFYEPSYYKEFLDTLASFKIPQNISFTFLGNPLYDVGDCYESLQGIIPNPVFIQYNTCNDLNEFYRKEPHSEGVRYYSDIEASGLTDSSNYYYMICMFDKIVEHMEEMNYSPLEKLIYVSDYFKKNFIYDPDYMSVNHTFNASLDKVYCKDRMICEGFSNLYSALLRRSGVLCFTYGTDDHQKNIVRVKDDKYGIDNLAILDPTWDLDHDDNRNHFENFLIPLDSDLYAYSENGVQTPSVISIPSSLVMASEYYYTYLKDSNPLYATDALGYGIRMLQLMGLGSLDVAMTAQEMGEYYKSALHRSGLLDEIPYFKVASAISSVRSSEGDYKTFDKDRDYLEFSDSLMNRGYQKKFAPKIRLFNGREVEVLMYDDSLSVDFVLGDDQAKVLYKPRRRGEEESYQDYDAYLKKFYHTMFYERGGDDMKEELEEYEIVDLENENDKASYSIGEDSGSFDVDDTSFEGDESSFVESLEDEVLDREEESHQSLEEVLDEKREPSHSLKEEGLDMEGESHHSLKEEAFDMTEEVHSSLEETVENEEDYYDTIVIYRDVDDSGRTFVTKAVLDRFHLALPVFKLELTNNIDIYEISPYQAIYIIENANNHYAPYKIRYQDFDFANELRDEYAKKDKKKSGVFLEEIQIYRDVDDSGRAFVSLDVVKRFHLDNLSLRVSLDGYDVYEISPVDAINIINHADNNYAPYGIRYVNIQFDREDNDQENLIAGTHYQKPRGRDPHESDEEYVSYLENYYEKFFGKDESLIPGTYHKKPRGASLNESWVDYESYLKNYYDRIFPKDQARLGKNLDNLLNKPIFRQRSKREDETLEEYESYLSTFYDIVHKKGVDFEIEDENVEKDEPRKVK